MERNRLQERTDQLLHAVEHVRPDHWNLRISDWGWNSGVCLYGISRVFEATKDERYSDFIQTWFEHNAVNRKFGSVNWVIPANAALLLYKLSGERRYLDICDEYADWCLNKALRTGNGGFAHVWGEGGLEDYKNQLWIDSLFMAGLFMLRYGVWSRSEQLIEGALAQFDIHIDCQFDPDFGLFYHGYHCVDRKVLGERWGRGNGWAAASLAELLEGLKDTTYNTDRYRDVFAKLMDRAYQLQTEEGMLRTLPEDPEAYVETTATALFGYAALKGARLGVLDERYAAWGREIVARVQGDITSDGIVKYASGGTDCQEKAGYFRVPYAQTLYAYGIVFMLLAEGMEVSDGA